MFDSDRKKEETVSTPVVVDDAANPDYLYFKQSIETKQIYKPGTEPVKEEEKSTVRGYSRSPHR